MPPGWVLPEWPSLSRRSLILGLPLGAAGTLLITVVFMLIVLRMVPAALILLMTLWTVGVAFTRYDPWSWEIALGCTRVPRTLRAR